MDEGESINNLLPIKFSDVDGYMINFFEQGDRMDYAILEVYSQEFTDES